MTLHELVAKGSGFRFANVPAHQLLLRFEGLQRFQLQRLASFGFTSEDFQRPKAFKGFRSEVSQGLIGFNLQDS
jgi:hypothetical protein